MNIIIILYLIVSLFCQYLNGQQAVNCGEWDAYKDEKCYKVFDNTYVQNFSAASNTCSQYQSTSLVTIHSEEVQEFLLSLIYNTRKILNDVWIGADYRNKTFKWSDNSTANYTNWANGYPDNSGYECVSMGFSNHGKWLNEPCGKMNSIVCQKTPNWSAKYLEDTVIEIRESSKNLNKQLNDTKSELDYYKSELKHVLNNASTGCALSQEWVKCGYFSDFRTNLKQVIAIPKLQNEKYTTRENALSICKKYNSTLVSIETPEKQLFLETFIASNTSRVWTSGYNSEDKVWRWINGHEIKYTHWFPPQPDNGYPIEPCLEIALDVEFKWNDIPCTVSDLVLCEFDAVN